MFAWIGQGLRPREIEEGRAKWQWWLGSPRRNSGGMWHSKGSVRHPLRWSGIALMTGSQELLMSSERPENTCEVVRGSGQAGRDRTPTPAAAPLLVDVSGRG